MTVNEIKEEINKCKNNPYYFATKYIKFKHEGKLIDFATPFSEEDFNKLFKSFEND